MKKWTFITSAIIAVLAIGISLFIGYYHQAVAQNSDSSYISGKKCKSCHAKIFTSQAETSHAKSFDILVDLGEDKNTKCIPCHTTGYGKPGGFTDAQATADLAGITCQTCHGPGSNHVKSGLTKEQRKATISVPTVYTCTKCHNVHKDFHTDLGNKELIYLKKKVGKLQNRIKELGG